MAYTSAAVRAFGSSRVHLVTVDGSFTGRFLSDGIGERAVVVLFAVEGDRTNEPRVIHIERIERIDRAEPPAGAP